MWPWELEGSRRSLCVKSCAGLDGHLKELATEEGQDGVPRKSHQCCNRTVIPGARVFTCACPLTEYFTHITSFNPHSNAAG